MTDEIMELMKKKGTYYVPTIVAGVTVSEMAKDSTYFPAMVRPKAARIGPQIEGTFARAYKAGVKIAFGTDSGVSPHGENAREFELMVKCGMPPMKAIQSATLEAAKLSAHRRPPGHRGEGQGRGPGRRCGQSAGRHLAHAGRALRDEGGRRLQGERQAGRPPLTGHSACDGSLVSFGLRARASATV